VRLIQGGFVGMTVKDAIPDLGYYYFVRRSPEEGVADGAILFLGITFVKNNCYAVYRKLSPHAEALRLPHEYCSVMPISDFTGMVDVNGVPTPMYERVTDQLVIRELRSYAKKYEKAVHA